MKITDKHGQRKAISPIIATVLIIAVTLIASVAIGGFVFGIFGQQSASAQIQVTGTTLIASTLLSTNSLAAFTCPSATPASGHSYLTLTNTGTASATVTGATVTWAGANNAFAVSGTCSVGAAGSTTATLYLDLTATNKLTVSAVQGQSFTGTVTLSNGATILFTGNFQ